MAAFRLVYFPSPVATPAAAARFAHAHAHAHLFLPYSPPNSFLLSFTPKPLHSSNFHLFIPPPQVQAQPTVLSESESTSVLVDEDDATNARVLVQNVPWTCTADDLRPLLQKYGTVVDIEFSMYNKRRNRGLAFVTMGSHEEAVAALHNLESTVREFDGRVLKLNWAKPKKAKPPSPPPQPKPMPVHNLFVANLPFQAAANDLKEFFIANGGNVVSAEVIFQENRRSAGYGFVSFKTKAESEAALVAFQGKEFMGRPLRVARSKRFLREETKAAIQSESDK